MFARCLLKVLMQTYMEKRGAGTWQRLGTADPNAIFTTRVSQGLNRALQNVSRSYRCRYKRAYQLQPYQSRVPHVQEEHVRTGELNRKLQLLRERRQQPERESLCALSIDGKVKGLEIVSDEAERKSRYIVCAFDMFDMLD